MEIHEMQTELTDTVNVIVGDLAKQIQEKHPDLTYAAAAGAARLDVAINVLFSAEDNATQTNRVRSLILDRMVKENADWAVNYHSVVTESLYRPAYEAAIEAGVDPAVVIAANCKVPLKEARAVARGFKKEDATAQENAAVSKDDSADGQAD